MKLALALTILAMTAPLCAAQDRMADSLRKGIVEEESKHNLNSAIQNYQAALSQFDEARQIAATALFRMAECYRKQGKDDQAMAAYKRLLQEFADQGRLAEQSRSILADTWHTEIPPNKQHNQALQNYRASLLEEVSLIEKEVRSVRQRIAIGALPPEELDRVQIKLVQAQRQVAAFDAGIPQEPSRK